MTPVDALVAEAIQLARESTPPLVNECARVTYRGTDSAWAWYTRDDVRDAALTHLATRAVAAEERAEALADHARKIEAVMKDVVKLRLAAEGRAERAEARIVKLRAALDGAAERAGHLGALSVAEILDDALCIDVLDADQPDAEKEAGRG